MRTVEGRGSRPLLGAFRAYETKSKRNGETSAAHAEKINSLLTAVVFHQTKGHSNYSYSSSSRYTTSTVRCVPTQGFLGIH